MSKASLVAPLRVRAYRAMWSANIVSNIGSLMQAVGAAWLMTGLTSSTVLVGMVQTAGTLPVFLVGPLAGALADLVPRKRLLFWSQAWMLAMAGLLAALTGLGRTTPWMLLGLTFAIGLGGAISLPAWQATVQDIVPKAWLASAVSLNSISFNVARAIGPAVGGMVVAAVGAAGAFAANAISFLAVLVAVASWKPESPRECKQAEEIASAIRAGIRYLQHAPRLQAPIARTAAYTLCAAAVWPLLPLVARGVLHTSATGYGLLLAAFGVGSITSALAIPRLRSRFALDRVLAAGSIVAALSLLGLSAARTLPAAAAALFFSGTAWVGVIINFNVAVQTSVPAWVRGRALSLYLIVFQGMLAVAGVGWGWLAGAIGTPLCFVVAATGLVLGLALIPFFPLSLDEEIDFSPPDDWPMPHPAYATDPGDGPVLVTVEYLVAPESSSEFRALMRDMRRQRLRDGARRWRLYHDLENPRRFVELFRLDSWREHLLQHERLTAEDMPVRSALLALHQGPQKPRVDHFLAVND